MENVDMMKISKGGLVTEYGYIVYPVLIWIGAVSLIVFFASESEKGFNLNRDVAWVLFIVIFFLAAITFHYRKMAGYVLESMDGTFLLVKICSTERKLPLSAIQSVKGWRSKHSTHLTVKVKRRTSPNDFSPGATFWFTPNEGYAYSALARQFPIGNYPFDF